MVIYCKNSSQSVTITIYFSQAERTNCTERVQNKCHQSILFGGFSNNWSVTIAPVSPRD